MRFKSAGLVVAGTVTAASVAIAVPVLTNAQTPSPASFTVQDKVQSVAMDDVAPKSKTGKVSLGDRLVTRQAVFDGGRKRVGTLYTDCAGAGPTKAFDKATLLCTLSYTFANGQVIAAGAFKLDGSGVLPIVGGSGAYAGAAGTVSSARPAKGYDSADTITIAG